MYSHQYDEKCAKCNTFAADSANINSEQRRFHTSKLPICPHSFCDKCFDELTKGRSVFICPYVVEPLSKRTCGTRLARSDLEKRSRDEIEVDIDLENRKKVRRIFNKTGGDFDSLEQYYEYIEKVENIIESLNSGQSTFESNRDIEQYMNMNRQMISKNNERRAHQLQEEKEEIMKLDKINKLIQEIHNLEDKSTAFEKELKRIRAINSLDGPSIFYDESHNKFFKELEKKRAELNLLKGVGTDDLEFAMTSWSLEGFLAENGRNLDMFKIDSKNSVVVKDPPQSKLTVLEAGGFDLSAVNRRNWAIINSDIDWLIEAHSKMVI